MALPNNRTAEHTSTSTTIRKILKTTNLFVGPLEEIKQKKAASTSLNSSVMDIFGDKFDRYVQLQETKVDVMTRMEQKMIEAQPSFQEAQATIQTKPIWKS
uniref:Uncharacterized protein n=1 Tax=Lactuca sativa TaxID=4236 RepID=A0A9R1X266_LACSA|nr:hypothetical protein LSAT_V11C700350320 [Lactuca sativa]